MKHIFIPTEGDKEQIRAYVKRLSDCSDDELIEAYNKQAKMGIVEVHQQALYLLGLRQVLMERFGDSPIILDHNCLISLERSLSE